MPYSSGTFSRVHDFTDDRDNGIRIQASRMDAEMDGIATGLSTALLKDGTQTATAKIPFAVGLSVIDNQTILLGTNSDIAIQYDETTNDSLEISANVEGAALGIVLKSDQGDDNADQHKLSIADGGTLTLGSKISGSFVSYLTHTPNSTVASSTLAVAGNLTVGGNLTLGSGAELSEAELEMLDGITAGTVAASKAVVVDANKDIASFRNVTLTGELDAATGDFSGDVDVDGTLEADAMTLNGTAITATATLDTGISNNNVPKFTSGVADDDFLRVNGTAIEGRSASEVLSDIGGQASLTFGISNTNAVKIDSSSVADDEYARFTANGLESRSTSEVLSDIGGQAALTFGISDTNIPIFTSGVADDDFLKVNGTSIEGRSASEVFSDIGASPAEGSSSIVTTGALNAGSITSGFGTIDTGSSNITSTGVGTFGSLDISGDIDVDGTTNLDVVDIDGAVDMASTLTVTGVSILNGGIDVAGDIILDVGGADIIFKDDGTQIGRIRNASSGELTFQGDVQDKNMVFNGNDGGSTITALTLDMSAAGNATFNGTVLASNGTSSLPSLSFSGDPDTGIYRSGVNNLGFAVGGARAFMSATQFNMTGNGVFSGTLTASSGNVTISDGNLVVASGHGIDFGATGGPTNGTGSSELLDDYEEGTFTPILQNSGGVQPAAYDLQTGFYTKIGRLVHASGTVSPNGLGSVSGGVLLGGLPFDSLSTSNNNSSLQIGHAANLNTAAGRALGGFLPGNTTNAQVHIYDAADGVSQLQFSELSADGQLTYSIQYQTA
ncbi:hypothetical protein N9S98_00335 [Alphaproteobacteria bacterium]|nr:hypothetical protein [Alphaproteobacteria bacterium]